MILRIRVKKAFIVLSTTCALLLFFYYNSNKQRVIQVEYKEIHNTVLAPLAETKRFILQPVKSNITFVPDNSDKYILKISKERINKLFKKLHEKEKVYTTVLDKLDLLSFDKLKEKNDQNYFSHFKDEINDYLKINGDSVEVTDSFIEYLYKKSDQHTFKTPRNHVNQAKISKVHSN